MEYIDKSINNEIASSQNQQIEDNNTNPTVEETMTYVGY